MGDKTNSPGPEQGWHPDPEDATSLRYWDGEAWTARAPQPPPPAAAPSVWRQGRVIALGILMAVGVLWAVSALTAPSEVDCAMNEVDRSLAQAEGKPLPAKLDRCP